MFRKYEIPLLFLTDALMLCLAWYLFYLARFEWHWFAESVSTPPSFWGPMLAVVGFWLVVFLFSGLYRERFAESRFDELVTIVKVVTVGILILFFALFIETLQAGSAHLTISVYWVALVVLVSMGRMGLRMVQKSLLLRGIGTRNALIVGWSDRVEKLHEEVARYPAAGLNVVGAVKFKAQPVPIPVLEGVGAAEAGSFEASLHQLIEEEYVSDQHAIEELPRLIEELKVQDVLITLGSDEQYHLLEVLQVCDGQQVRLKLVPDFYHLVAGMARTEHIYGLPLIEVLPVPMPFWEQSTKQVIDILVAVPVLVLGLPLWIAIGLLIRFSSPGPAIFRQVRVGRHGKAFTMYKFRTMYHDAERATGPVWASDNDPRYTPIGRWLRKTRIDEVPQFWNVLKGEMSLVGPRPERPYFVERLSKEIPLYSRRHRVKPGITGLAQVKWKYDTSLEDVRQKVKYDLFYIENMGLSMDFKILFQTIRTAILGKGQ